MNEQPTGMVTRTFRCESCDVPYTLTVPGVGADDPAVIERLQLLAASQHALLDGDGVFWCETHRSGVREGRSDGVQRADH